MNPPQDSHVSLEWESLICFARVCLAKDDLHGQCVQPRPRRWLSGVGLGELLWAGVSAPKPRRSQPVWEECGK